jgi:integrase
LRRSCICKDAPDVLCGSCALAAQVRHHSSSGRGPRDRIFGLDPAQCLRLLRDICSRLGLPSPSWHAFRRGMASDMLASGSSLSAILRAGGWRSAAFLRYLRSQDLDEREALDFTLAISDPES